jgi:hypothetical protein
MTPQSSLMVVAPLVKGGEAPLRTLLSSMNVAPGRVNSRNSVVPFGEFDTLHFARFVILDDATTGDIAVYGVQPPAYPLSLAFLADFDGDYNSFLRDLVQRAGDGLRRVFSHCDGFSSSTDLLSWMKQYEHRPSTYYVNWVGRTGRQCREEAALRDALIAHLQSAPEIAKLPAGQLRQKLREFVLGEQRRGALTLTAAAKTPAGWWLRNALHAVLVAPALLGAVTVWGVVLLLSLRGHEKADPVIAPRPDAAQAARLAEIEDYEVTNQFSAMGSLKPGLFRAWTLRLILWAIDYTARHVYTRGRLARVHTIHFARWVFIDNGKRLFFASNYDGSLDSYMDDFINKVSFGLNVVFGNGVGYPTTRWLLLDGAKDEQTFKYFLRRHELPTDVWYNAHTGFTAFDLHRNSVLRQGLEASGMTDGEARQWAALL